MAPQRLEKIESAPGNGMASEASKPQGMVHRRAANRAREGRLVTPKLRHARSLIRGGGAAAGRPRGKFSALQPLEKPQNGKMHEPARYPSSPAILAISRITPNAPSSRSAGSSQSPRITIGMSSPTRAASPANCRRWISRERVARSSSIRVAVRARRKERHQDDLHVQPQRPVVDIIEIVLEPLVHVVIVGDFAAMTPDLRPARDARLDVVPAGITREPFDIALVVRERVRARTDDRHFADEDIDQLRQLVDAVAPEDGADACDPGVCPRGLDDIGPVVHRRHRAELEDAERLLVEAVALLPKQRGTKIG